MPVRLAAPSRFVEPPLQLNACAPKIGWLPGHQVSRSCAAPSCPAPEALAPSEKGLGLDCLLVKNVKSSEFVGHLTGWIPRRWSGSCEAHSGCRHVVTRDGVPPFQREADFSISATGRPSSKSTLTAKS